MQDDIVDAMNKLILAVRPHLEKLKLVEEASG